MRILLKCPTRGRREKFLSTIRKWVELAHRPESLGIAVSLDSDDVSMGNFTEADLPNVAWKRVYRGPNKTKIQACNADIENVEWPWDIIILVSDDMIPEVDGYDMKIREAMPDSLDHVVWVHDGFQNEKLNTLNIFGRARYNSWGYMYYPEYKSFYCDNELTDWCRENPSKCTIISEVLIRHHHPLANGSPSDVLYERNQRHFVDDAALYERRKNATTAQSRFGFLKVLSRR